MNKPVKAVVMLSMACLSLYAAKGPSFRWDGDICGQRGGCVQNYDGCWVNGNCDFQVCYGTECLDVEGGCTETLVRGPWQRGNCGGCGSTWICTR